MLFWLGWGVILICGLGLRVFFWRFKVGGVGMGVGGGEGEVCGAIGGLERGVWFRVWELRVGLEA